MKKIACAVVACALLVSTALAQLPVNPPQNNPPQIYMFSLVAMLLHATGNWSALYFQSIDRFDNREDCEKRMYKSAAKFKGDMLVKMQRKMPLKDIKFFGACNIMGQPQEMMFPFEEPATDKKQKDPNVLPQ